MLNTGFSAIPVRSPAKENLNRTKGIHVLSDTEVP